MCQQEAPAASGGNAEPASEDVIKLGVFEPLTGATAGANWK